MSLNAMSTTKTHEKLSEAAAQGTRATLWGIVASSVLAAVKIIGGLLGNSDALIADTFCRIKLRIESLSKSLGSRMSLRMLSQRLSRVTHQLHA